MKIVLLESLQTAPELMDKYGQEIEKRGHSFVEYERTSDLDMLQKETSDADVIILGNMPLPAKVIETAKQLKYIDVAFTGVDHIPVTAAKKKGIVISNASGYATESTAQLAIADLIALLRKIPELEADCRKSQPAPKAYGSTLEGKTVGIVGAGHIGRRVAQIASVLGAHVIAFNRSAIQDEAIEEQVDLDTLMERSDAISIHLPLTDATRHLINAEKISKMKPEAVLVNTARGPVADEAALAAALNENRIAGAAIDVFDTEPPLPQDHPLLHSKNTIVTPHIGYDTKQSMEKRAKIVFDNLFAWLDGTILNEVKV